MSAVHDFEVFWGEMSPCEHSVQIYDDDVTFFDALEGFIAGALRREEAAVVIATPSHRHILAKRLRAQGLDLDGAAAQDRYIAFDVTLVLAQFMRQGWPDEELFRTSINGILDRARGDEGRPVRAFGEMVAVLWAQGHSGATVRLEHLWHSLCREEAFSLFCAYPRSGFTKDAEESMREICAAHSKVLGQVH
jgi:hypothetical protein